MKPTPDVSPETSDQYASPVAHDEIAEQNVAHVQEVLAASDSEPASPKRPTLLDRFYYWVMSRS